MPHRVQRAWLNGLEFASVHPALMLQHINEQGPKISYKTAERPGGGLMELARVISQRDIILEFAIREGLDFAARQHALQAATAWAMAGGVLELSDHPGQFIRVSLTQAPAMGQLRDWTHDLSMTFTAAWYPYWQDKQLSTVSISGMDTGSAELFVLGTAQTCLEAEISPVASPLHYLTLTSLQSSMGLDLSSAPVQVGSTIRIDYDERHLLRIMCGTDHLLRYRFGADDVILMPGQQTIMYSCSVPCYITLKSRGVWL